MIITIFRTGWLRRLFAASYIVLIFAAAFHYHKLEFFSATMPYMHGIGDPLHDHEHHNAADIDCSLHSLSSPIHTFSPDCSIAPANLNFQIEPFFASTSLILLPNLLVGSPLRAPPLS